MHFKEMDDTESVITNAVLVFCLGHLFFYFLDHNPADLDQTPPTLKYNHHFHLIFPTDRNTDDIMRQR